MKKFHVQRRDDVNGQRPTMLKSTGEAIRKGRIAPLFRIVRPRRD